MLTLAPRVGVVCADVVSDCIAIQQVHTTHFFANSLNEAAAMCLEAGTDWDLCGGYLEHLREAVSQHQQPGT